MEDARAQFEENQLAATFMQGELFDPMREAVAAGASKPKFVYIYPPQESGEKGERPADAAYFTFRPLHFFELIARESEALEAML